MSELTYYVPVATTADSDPNAVITRVLEAHQTHPWMEVIHWIMEREEYRFEIRPHDPNSLFATHMVVGLLTEKDALTLKLMFSDLMWDDEMAPKKIC